MTWEKYYNSASKRFENTYIEKVIVTTVIKLYLRDYYKLIFIIYLIIFFYIIVITDNTVTNLNYFL